MHVLINVKSRNNISKWQMGFNSAFKGLKVFWLSICNIYVLHIKKQNLFFPEDDSVEQNYVGGYTLRRI
jgi:hypothetical protein